MLCKLKEKIPLLFSSGILTASVGVMIYFMFPIMMHNEIKKRMVLKEGSESYKNWKNIPVPIYLHIYFFNVTNTAEIYNLTNKPVLQQLGPYTFREEREKNVISINDNDTITYRQVKRWYFEPDMTVGSLDDIVTTLNIPMVAAAAKAKQLNRNVVYYSLQGFFDLFESTWFVQRSVRELMFEGYEDPLLDLAKKFMGMPFDKFGWFYQRNNTDDGEVNIFSGQNNIEELDKINTWDGTNTTTGFRSPCNMINGTAGDLWPPPLTKDSKLTMFVPEMCRSVSLNYLTEVPVNGIRAYRYWSDETQLDNGKYDLDNRCFCIDSACLPAGALDVSLCKYESPVAVSYPHFLFADPVYREGVIGLNPDPEEHRMFLDIIPEMGFAVRVAARLQINIIFEAIPDIEQFNNITERIYFPVFWFSETAEVGKDMSAQLNFLLNTVPWAFQVLSLVIFLIGISFILTTLVIANPFKRKDHQLYSAVECK